MKGQHVQQDERIYGATLLDVTPTILTLLGLPVGADMDGRVLVQAFEEPPQIARIPSWEQEPGECGMHPSDLRMDPATQGVVIVDISGEKQVAGAGAELDQPVVAPVNDAIAISRLRSTIASTGMGSLKTR